MEKSNEFTKGIKFSFNETINYADQAVVSKQILKQQKGNITLFAFDKDQELTEHKTPFDALVTIIDGKANILEAGESIIMPANIAHALKAVEKFKMVLTMIKND
jgi:quercetin dioxygenase-like cupin family protein